MKHNLFYLLVCCVALLSTGCDKSDEIRLTDNDPSVALSLKGAAKRTNFTITFEPKEAVSWEYALTRYGERSTFEDGTMPGIVKVDDIAAIDVVFNQDVVPQATYTVYARAYDEKGNPGAVASIMVETLSSYAGSDDLSGELSWATPTSAAFKMTGDLEFYKLEYAIGTADDRSAFDEGTLDGILERAESEVFTGTFFELEPATDYVIFYRAYNRANVPTDVLEIPVTTPSMGASAWVDFEVRDVDVWKGDLTLTGNAQCASYSFFVTPLVGDTFQKGLDDPFSFQGDPARVFMDFEMRSVAIRVWDSVPFDFSYLTPQSAGQGGLVTYLPPALETDAELYVYIGMFDTDEKFLGAFRHKYATPEYDDSLTPATVTATATNITDKGATIQFTASENTFGIFFDTIDADYYDQLIQSDDYTENYLRDLFFMDPNSGVGYYWQYYKDGFPDHVDTSMKPDPDPDGDPSTDDAKTTVRFRIAICPMNANGASDPDWGKLWISEEVYETLPVTE